MALKNVLGGIALDETLKQILERFRDWKDPQWVTSHPDMPVHVAGRVIPQPDPVISSQVRSVAAAITAGVIVPGNVSRMGLSIANASTSILYVIASPTQTVASTLYTVLLNPNDHWELPQGVGGCYKGPLAGIWVAANGSAMITEYS